MAIPYCNNVESAALSLVKTASAAEKKALDASQLVQWFKGLSPGARAALIGGGVGGVGGLLTDLQKDREERTPLRSLLTGGLAGGLLGLGGNMAYQHGKQFMEGETPKPPATSGAQIEPTAENPFAENPELAKITQQISTGQLPHSAAPPELTPELYAQYFNSAPGIAFASNQGTFGGDTPVSQQISERGLDVPNAPAPAEVPPLMQTLYQSSPTGQAMVEHSLGQHSLSDWVQNYPKDAPFWNNPASPEGAIQYGGPAAGLGYTGLRHAYGTQLRPIGPDILEGMEQARRNWGLGGGKGQGASATTAPTGAQFQAIQELANERAAMQRFYRQARPVTNPFQWGAFSEREIDIPAATATPAPTATRAPSDYFSAHGAPPTGTRKPPTPGARPRIQASTVADWADAGYTERMSRLGIKRPGLRRWGLGAAGASMLFMPWVANKIQQGLAVPRPYGAPQ